MGGVKFCRDCKWCKVGVSRQFFVCENPDSGTSIEADLVTGAPVRHDSLCMDVRADEALCGEHAKWFEPKE